MEMKKSLDRKWRATARVGVFALILQMVSPAFVAAQDNSGNTTSPIKHVIVIIGENRTFDHVFATYKPKSGEIVDNLLSKGIVNEDGTPGPNFALALQYSAVDTHEDKYQINPMDKSLYPVLPAPLTGGPTNVCKNNGVCTLAEAQASENGLASGYYKFMLTGGTGQPSRVPDQRIQNVNNLPPGPFQLTSSSMPYDAYAASPVHRFYQMWQQLDCDTLYSTEWNPSGCRSDLFPWVEVTVGAGSNGRPQPSNFSTEPVTRKVNDSPFLASISTLVWSKTA